MRLGYSVHCSYSYFHPRTAAGHQPAVVRWGLLACGAVVLVDGRLWPQAQKREAGTPALRYCFFVLQCL